MTVRLVPGLPRPDPKLEPLEVSWQMRGPSGRALSCGIYRTDVGIEVRCGYAEDLIRSQYVGDVVTARAIAEEWREAVLAKGGFTELRAT